MWRTTGNEAILKLQKFLSVVLLGLVNVNYRFLWASLGCPGNAHDSTYFQSTSLGDDITSRKTLPWQVVEINGVEIPPVFGNDDFPLQSEMMKLPGDAVLTQEKACFDFHLS